LNNSLQNFCVIILPAVQDFLAIALNIIAHPSSQIYRNLKTRFYRAVATALGILLASLLHLLAQHPLTGGVGILFCLHPFFWPPCPWSSSLI
jgi:hypothetical protein